MKNAKICFSLKADRISERIFEMIRITFDDIGEHIERGDLKDWVSELKAANAKDEPTISKMEQVDKDINVRSKDEPQTDCAWK